MKLFEHKDFEQAILGAEQHFRERKLRPAIIEKDYYVTEALRIIAAAAPDKIIFKGALFDLQVHEDGGLCRAVQRARGQGRYLGAEVPRPRQVVSGENLHRGGLQPHRFLAVTGCFRASSNNHGDFRIVDDAVCRARNHHAVRSSHRRRRGRLNYLAAATATCS